MKRKKVIMLFLGITMIMFLTGCKVSKDYQGDWYGLDAAGKRVKLNYSEKKLTVTGDKEYDLSQFGVGIENNTKYYQVKIDGEKYVVIFPDKNELNAAVVIKPDDEDNLLEGKILFSMNRKKFPTE
jgi:hypothetical protein